MNLIWHTLRNWLKRWITGHFKLRYIISVKVEHYAKDNSVFKEAQLKRKKGDVCITMARDLICMKITSTHNLQCLWQELIRAMTILYYIRDRSEIPLMNITLIWEDISRNMIQFTSICCLCNSLLEVKNQHGQHIYTEIKMSNISFIHFIITLRQGDIVNHHVLYRWHKRWI